MSAPPSLNCPECDEPLIEAQSRGFAGPDGEAEHRISCRCYVCEWRWVDDGQTFRCACGALARVDIDDDRARSVLVPEEES